MCRPRPRADKTFLLLHGAVRPPVQSGRGGKGGGRRCTYTRIRVRAEGGAQQAGQWSGDGCDLQVTSEAPFTPCLAAELTLGGARGERRAASCLPTLAASSLAEIARRAARPVVQPDARVQRCLHLAVPGGIDVVQIWDGVTARWLGFLP